VTWSSLGRSAESALCGRVGPEFSNQIGSTALSDFGSIIWPRSAHHFDVSRHRLRRLQTDRGRSIPGRVNYRLSTPKRRSDSPLGSCLAGPDVNLTLPLRYAASLVAVAAVKQASFTIFSVRGPLEQAGRAFAAFSDE